jgi:hypothetical protein
MTVLIDMLLGPLGGALAALVAVLGALWAAYRKGRATERTDREARDARAQADAYRKRQEKDDDVQSDPDLARRANEWVRKRD